MMTLGKKIKLLRTNKGITQESLAEELNVSRSAIAKWESGHGIPDVSNLKAISNIFHISVDALIDETKTVSSMPNTSEEGFHSPASEYNENYYDIDLKGWNDGVYDILITGEDCDFLFYQKPLKSGNIFGLIGKKYIAAMAASKTSNLRQDDRIQIDRSYFYGKHVSIELACKEGFWKGFFDFRSDDYLDVFVDSFSESTVRLRFGQEIEIGEIAKIEEITS